MDESKKPKPGANKQVSPEKKAKDGPTAFSSPHHYPKIPGTAGTKEKTVHVSHATDPAHKDWCAYHVENPTDEQFDEAVGKAKKDRQWVMIHGNPPPKFLAKLTHEHAQFAQEQVKKSELAKGFFQGDGTTVTDQNRHANILGSLPESLKRWGAEKISSLPKDTVQHLELDGKRIKVHKHDSDLYSGTIEHEGKQLHDFNKVTLPELLGQLQSKLDLYGREDAVTGYLPEESKPDVGAQLKDLKAKIQGAAAPQAGAFNETAADEAEESKEFKDTHPSASEQMAFDEMNELEEQLKQFRSEVQTEFGPLPKEEVETIQGKELLSAMNNDQKDCPACERPFDRCLCFSNMPMPTIQILPGRISIFFKSEYWDEESRSAFVQDLKRRTKRIMRGKA